MNKDQEIRWTARHDISPQPGANFNDLAQIVAGTYEMYSKMVDFIGPWISRQRGMNMFIPPDREQLKAIVNNCRSCISFKTKSAFVDAIYNFTIKSQGKRALITPNISTHHSAQFPTGTFSIEKVEQDPKSRGMTVKINLAGAVNPVYVDSFKLKPDSVKFIIIRPKLGKLGTPSASNWEILFFNRDYGYLVDHVDSNINPRWAGIL